GDDIYNITWDAYSNFYDGGADTNSINYVGSTALTLNLQIGDDTVTNSGVTDTFTNMDSITLGAGIDIINVTDASGYSYVGSGSQMDIFYFGDVDDVTVFDAGDDTDYAYFDT